MMKQNILSDTVLPTNLEERHNILFFVHYTYLNIWTILRRHVMKFNTARSFVTHFHALDIGTFTIRSRLLINVVMMLNQKWNIIFASTLLHWPK